MIILYFEGDWLNKDLFLLKTSSERLLFNQKKMKEEKREMFLVL